MGSLFNSSDLQQLYHRIEQLRPETQPLWGKMDVAQMLAHCTLVLRNSLGDLSVPPNRWVQFLIAPFLRHRYYSQQPFRIKNNATSIAFRVSTSKEINAEKAILIQWMDRFNQEGRERCLQAVHPQLGKFTPEQWAIGQYKHLDHHLRQFGV